MGQKTEEPHVLFLPTPLLGHVKPMLTVAELLSQAGLRVTFVNSHHNQARLDSSPDMAAFRDRHPKFRFVSISDGLPPDHPRSGPRAFDLMPALGAVTKPEFRGLLVDLLSGENGKSKPLTCVIADSFVCFAVEFALEFGIPAIAFSTMSAFCTWVYCHIFKLVQEGEVPFKGDDLDKTITCIPGLEGILRLRDLPEQDGCRAKQLDSRIQFYINELAIMKRASGLILNTFEAMEAPYITKLASLFPKVYPLGPFHTFLESSNAGVGSSSMTSPSSGLMLRKEDRSCLAWLDTKPPRSVIYVSFGSLVGLTRDQILEFWHGLVNSGKAFLWVVRHDLVLGEDGIGKVPEELQVATTDRGCIVDWPPQVEVLAHGSVGGFLTHSGWNSTLESITSGVPMICWPVLGDQFVNSRFVGEVLRMGLDMKDTCDRSIVEKMVRDLMEGRKRAEMLKLMEDMSRKARGSVKEGGSSCGQLNVLIEDLRSMASTSGRT